MNLVKVVKLVRKLDFCSLLSLNIIIKGKKNNKRSQKRQIRLITLSR